MSKRIMSVVMSALLVVVAILFLQNEKVVEAADDMVLLEKRHPGYWEWFHENAIELNNNDADSEHIVIYPISKFFLNKITDEDFKLVQNNLKSAQARHMIYFLDGTGVDLSDLSYGEIDLSTWNLNKICSANNLTTIKEIEYKGVDFQAISNIYLYLSALRDNNYSFIIALQDDASTSWNESLTHIFHLLGLQGGFRYRDSYIAVVENGVVTNEQLSSEALSFRGYIDGSQLIVQSKGWNTGNDSNIKLNDRECSTRKRGLNIVVLQGTNIVDSVNFDTWDKSLPCNRQ